MLNLKSCPRCNGDMYSDRDMYGRFTHCLQCGNYLHVQDEPDISHTSLLEFAHSSANAPKMEKSDLLASA